MQQNLLTEERALMSFSPITHWDFPMSITGFFEELKKEEIRFYENEIGFLRTKEGDCPLTALCKKKGLGVFGVSQFEEAGKKLGLSELSSIRIAKAADDKTHSGNIRRMYEPFIVNA